MGAQFVSIFLNRGAPISLYDTLLQGQCVVGHGKIAVRKNYNAKVPCKKE